MTHQSGNPWPGFLAVKSLSRKWGADTEAYRDDYYLNRRSVYWMAAITLWVKVGVWVWLWGCVDGDAVLRLSVVHRTVFREKLVNGVFRGNLYHEMKYMWLHEKLGAFRQFSVIDLKQKAY